MWRLAIYFTGVIYFSIAIGYDFDTIASLIDATFVMVFSSFLFQELREQIVRLRDDRV